MMILRHGMAALNRPLCASVGKLKPVLTVRLADRPGSPIAGSQWLSDFALLIILAAVSLLILIQFVTIRVNVQAGIGDRATAAS